MNLVCVVAARLRPECIPDVANRQNMLWLLGVDFEFGTQAPHRRGYDAPGLAAGIAPHMPHNLRGGTHPAGTLEQQAQQVSFARRQIDFARTLDHTHLALRIERPRAAADFGHGQAARTLGARKYGTNTCE